MLFWVILYTKSVDTKVETLSITRLHLQGKVARRAFVQESLKCVTSPTSDRKYLQIGPNPRLPRMFIFWHTFISIEIKLPLVSVGTPLFYHLFYDRMWYLKQYRTYLGPKSGQNEAGHTHGRPDRRTSQFWGLPHKSPSGNNFHGAPGTGLLDVLAQENLNVQGESLISALI